MKSSTINRLVQRHRAVQSSARRPGAILPMFAVCIPMILVLGAFAINVAWMSLVDSQLQIASDTAARAGGREFAVTQNLQQAIDRAKEAVQVNKAGGRTPVLPDSGIKFGDSVLALSGPDAGRYIFTEKSVTQGTLGSGPGMVSINAVDITLSQAFGFSEMPMPIPLLSAPNGFTPRAASTSTQSDRDIVLVLDRSGSMNEYSTNFAAWAPAGPGQAYFGSRWRELADAVAQFNAILVTTPLHERVALATFSTTSSEDCVLSEDTTPIDSRMADITNNFLGGYTAIGDGIASGVNLITDPARARTFAKKTMIVMTDGIQNTGSDPVSRATNAFQNYGISVNVVTFSDGADQVEGAAIAAAGGGQHWHAANGAQLQLIFEELARTLPTMLTR